MGYTTALALSLFLILLTNSIQGSDPDNKCRLVLSPNNGFIKIRIGRSGSIFCGVSSQCDKRVRGIFWKDKRGHFIEPGESGRLRPVDYNSTTSALHFYRIQRENFGKYTCISRIGADMVEVNAFVAVDRGIEYDHPGQNAKQAGPVRRPLESDARPLEKLWTLLVSLIQQ